MLYNIIMKEEQMESNPIVEILCVV